jgi:hypothetical protein
MRVLGLALLASVLGLVACSARAHAPSSTLGGGGGDGGASAGGGTTTAHGGAGGATTSAGGAGGTIASGGAGGGAGGAIAAGGAGGSGPSPKVVGCADGTREGFSPPAKHPMIAACDGAWDQPGIFDMPVLCNREAGNDGKNAAGKGCTVSDLCAEGWHVCHGKDDVITSNPHGGPLEQGCEGVMDGATSPVFFTTQMSSTGAFECSTAADATNDLFGCGDLGCDFTSNPTVKALCAPLVMSSHDLCKGLRNDLGCGDWCNHLGKYPALTNAWDCGQDSTQEALHVTKTQADQQGGVLCCRD